MQHCSLPMIRFQCLDVCVNEDSVDWACSLYLHKSGWALDIRVGSVVQLLGQYMELCSSSPSSLENQRGTLFSRQG